MATQTPRVIPGVPMAAMDNIADPNVRDVLRAIVDGWHVRNGAAGSGDERFVTASEVGLSKGRSAVGGSYSNQMVPPGSPTITPGQVSRIINDLQAQVIESQLFKELGERINLIDKPGGLFSRVGATELVLTNEITQRVNGDTALTTSLSTLGTRVGTAEAGLITEKTQRVNADNAIQQTITTQYTSVQNSLALVQSQVNTVSNAVSSQAQTITQVQASVGQNATAIQQEATSRANADGVINSKYSVKIDTNNYVTGFGLMSTANNSVPFSEFIVRADRFAIGSPSGPGISPKIPFIVTTTPTVLSNGTIAPPGVYIEDGVFGRIVVGRANIGLAEIDTLRIAGSAVTVPLVVTSSSITNGAGVSNYITVLTGAITLDQAGMVYASSSGYIGYGSGWIIANTRLLINGVSISSGGGDEAWVSATHSGGLQCNAGTVTVQLQFAAVDSRARLYSPTIFIMAAKR